MKPEWQSARLASVLALNTTMRACEVRGLRWCDVDFLAGTVRIRRSKTKAGQRIIPLNDDALRAMRELYSRASAIAGTHPDHYVFPACENQRFDPTTSQKSWRSAWRSLRKTAGIAALCFHDLRHHAITELAESQASDATIMAIAGHLSSQMLEHYSTFVSNSSARQWTALRLAEALRRANQPFATQTATQARFQDEATTRQLIEKIGRGERI
jgi:integrase